MIDFNPKRNVSSSIGLHVYMQVDMWRATSDNYQANLHVILAC